MQGDTSRPHVILLRGRDRDVGLWPDWREFQLQLPSVASTLLGGDAQFVHVSGLTEPTDDGGALLLSLSLLDDKETVHGGHPSSVGIPVVGDDRGAVLLEALGRQNAIEETAHADACVLSDGVLVQRAAHACGKLQTRARGKQSRI